MTIGIAGLGLVGGSCAKAYREYAIDSLQEICIYGYDINASVMDEATSSNVINARLDESNIGMCDLILVALYPNEAIEYISYIAPYVNKNTIVMDLCGTKRDICQKAWEISDRYGFTFIGGHPMAGTHNSGYRYARASLFHGAPMVIVPRDLDDPIASRVKELLRPLGFGRYSIATANDHDRLIAFTSQLAHVVSNAYVKSPTAREHKGFSAGSYKDLTRVAWLNEGMWTELFFENKEPLIFEIDRMIDSLQEYSNALKCDDRDKMKELLRDGRIAKEEIDNR